MALNYTEKGQGLHAAIHAAGLSLAQVDGVWVADNEAAVQAIIDSYDPVTPARAAKWAQIQAERDRREVEGGFPVDFPGVGRVVFHSDLLSRSHLNNLFAGAFKMRLLGAGDDTLIPGAASNPGWKCVNRTERVPMTVKRCELLDAAATAHVGALHVSAAMHRAAIDAMTDWEDIAGYDFSGGWPAV
jgi:hypothetical protein